MANKPACRGTALLLTALALTVLEGAVRKWVIGTETGHWSHLAYFSKDLVFAALLLYPAQAETPAALLIFRKWLIPGCALLLGGAVLSAMMDTNPVGAALTVRAAVLLPVLGLFAAQRLLSFRVRQAACLLALLTVANCALGIVQNRLPATHVLNRYAMSEAVVTSLDSGVRATGTFSYITGLALFSSVGLWAGVVLLSLSEDRFYRIAGGVTVLAGLGCGLASISRGPVVVGAVMLLVWTLAGGGHSLRLKSLVAFITASILLTAVGLMPALEQLGRGVLERQATGGDSFERRAFGQVGQALEALSSVPLGNGLGTEQVAGNYVASGTPGFTTYEEQLPRLVLEVGVLGLLGYLVVCAGALLALESAGRTTPDRGHRAMCRVTQVLLGTLFYTNVVFNHTASAFAWIIFAGVMGASVDPTPLRVAPYGARLRSTDHLRRAGTSA